MVVQDNSSFLRSVYVFSQDWADFKVSIKINITLAPNSTVIYLKGICARCNRLMVNTILFF